MICDSRLLLVFLLVNSPLTSTVAFYFQGGDGLIAENQTPPRCTLSTLLSLWHERDSKNRVFYQILELPNMWNPKPVVCRVRRNGL